MYEQWTINGHFNGNEYLKVEPIDVVQSKERTGLNDDALKY